MPKLIVLFFGDDNSSLVLAEAAAAGAKSVRFMEVDLRAGAATTSTHKRLDSPASLIAYDGVLIATSGDRVPAELDAMFRELETSGSAENFVIAFAGEATGMLERVSQLGGIVVTSRSEGDATTRARALGARIAKVIGWVRHALGHEADHAHAHDHSTVQTDGHTHTHSHTHTHAPHDHKHDADHHHT